MINIIYESYKSKDSSVSVNLKQNKQEENHNKLHHNKISGDKGKKNLDTIGEKRLITLRGTNMSNSNFSSEVCKPGEIDQ